MFKLFNCVVFGIILIFCCLRSSTAQATINYEENIDFITYPSNNKAFNSSMEVDNFAEKGCKPSEPFAIIAHGWLESCNTEWVKDLLSNLTVHRGGCIVCMNYYNFSSNRDYFALVRQFPDIVKVLVRKLEQFERQGFNPDNGFMFGFSFGAHLVLESGRLFGEQKIKEIDVCDKAGPGFATILDPKLAAKNVQCIHTSYDKGSIIRNCNQNWNMGNCGFSQAAHGPFPKGSHGLCPYFYNSAFNNNFEAIPKPYNCASNRVASYPDGYRMGYLENRKSEVFGDLYAATTKYYPYNEVKLNNTIN